jgi:two-component system NtrC family sensor kinase
MLEDKSLELYRARVRLTEQLDQLQALNEDLQRSKVQLVQQEKMASLGILLAGVGHEINNPVGFVASNLYALQDYGRILGEALPLYKECFHSARAGVSLSQAATDRLEEIESTEDLDAIALDLAEITNDCAEGVDRIRSIVHALRTFSRADSAELVRTNIMDGLYATLKILSLELKTTCQLVTNLQPLPKIYCYPGQLNQVFLNLLINAADAVEIDGEILIETECFDSHLELRVSDTGCGIREQDLMHIFDPFFTTKPVGQGTGLGLAIASDVIKRHGGTLDVRSTPGEGSTFTVALPLGPPG